MIEIIGKYNKAKVLVSKIEDIETSCLEQIQKLLDQPFGSRNQQIWKIFHFGKFFGPERKR